MKINLGTEVLGTNPRLVGMSEKYSFSEGKRGSQIGTTLEILLPHAGFDKIRVSVPDMTLPVSQEDINASNLRFDPIKVQFEGFTASPYVDKGGNVAYSAKANRVLFPNFKKGVE